MGERPTSRQIDDQAADWAARRDRAVLSEADRVALDAWLADDPRAAGALLRAEAVALETRSARALGSDFDPGRFAGAAGSSPPSRRRLLAWAGAAAASVAAGGLALPLLTAGEAHATAVGEVRLVPLADGSTMTLNTDSRAVVRFDKGRREVEVTRGEAYFSVARDAARPFVVKLGARSVHAGGGAFTAQRLEAGRSEVTIQSGDLRLDAAGADRPVGANARVILRAEGGAELVAVAARDIDRSLVWREGKLAFEGESLAQAAAAFARYGGPRIRIDDPGLAQEPITGLFAANDPVGFSRAAALALDARVRPRDGDLVIVRQSPGESFVTYGGGAGQPSLRP